MRKIDELIIRYYKSHEGCSVVTAAAYFRVSPSTIRRTLKKHGVAIRPLSEIKREVQ